MVSVLWCFKKMKVTGYALNTIFPRKTANFFKTQYMQQLRLHAADNNVSLAPSNVRLQYDMIRINRFYKQRRCIPSANVINAIENLRLALATQLTVFEKYDALLLLRCCGKLTTDIPISKRKQLTQNVIHLLNVQDMVRDITYYNVLLQVMLENDSDIIQSEILREMKNNNVDPNQRTYMILLEYYSKKGNVTEANNTVTIMKDLNYPLTQEVYKSLITAHCKAGDVKRAEEILDSMKNTNIFPNSDTYTALICGYAKMGDIDNIRCLLCQSGSLPFLNGNILDIAYTLIVNNHTAYVDEVLSCLKEFGTFPMAEIEFIGNLLEAGHFKTSMEMFVKITPSLASNEHLNIFLRSVLYRFMSNSDMICKYIDDMCIQIDKNGNVPFFIDHAIHASFTQKNVEITYKLMKYKVIRGERLKPHFFWPLLARNIDSCDVKGVFDVVQIMTDYFKIEPCIKTVEQYIIPCVNKSLFGMRSTLLDLGIPSGTVDHAIVIRMLNGGQMHFAYVYVKNNGETSYRYDLLEEGLINALIKSSNCLKYYLILTFFNKSEANVSNGTDKDIFMAQSYNPYLENNLTQLMLREDVGVDRLLCKVIENCWVANTIFTKPLIKSIQCRNIPTRISDILDMMSKLPTMPDAVFTYLSRLSSNANKELYDDILIFEIYNMGDTTAMIDTLKLLELRECKLSFRSWMRVLRFFCGVNDLTQSQKYMDALRKTDYFFNLPQTIVISYMKLLLSYDAIGEVKTFLMDVWKMVITYRKVEEATVFACEEILTNLVQEGKVEEAIDIFELLKLIHFVRSKTIQCPEVIKYYTDRGDVDMALESLRGMSDKVTRPPHKHKLTKLIVEKKQGSALQRLINECVKIQDKKVVVFELIMDLTVCDYTNKALELYNTHKSLFSGNNANYSTIEYLLQYDHHELVTLYENARNLPSKLQSSIYDNVGILYMKWNKRDKVLALWNHMQQNNYSGSQVFRNYVKQLQKNDNVCSEEVSPQIQVDENTNALRP